MVTNFESPIVVDPFKFTWFEVEFPDPGPYEAVFRNRACLICGSDLHVYKGLHPFAPLPACCGHEVAAEVVEIGSKVTSLAVGDRVYVGGGGSTPCGQCFYCIRGDVVHCIDPHISTSFKIDGKPVARFPSGFGEYTIGHEGYAYKIPDNVSFTEAAVTTDMAYVTGVVKRSGAGIGSSAVILGSGPIGLRTLDVVKVAGVSLVIVSEPVDYRLTMAKELGAHEVINPLKEDPVERVLELTDGEGVDIVFDTAGNTKATNQGLEMLNTKMGGAGTLYLMGLYEHPYDKITIDVSSLMHKAGKIVAEWGVGFRNEIKDSLVMMSQGKLSIKKWVTHKMSEDRADEAMMMLIEKRDNAIGVQIVH